MIESGTVYHVFIAAPVKYPLFSAASGSSIAMGALNLNDKTPIE